MQVQPLDLSTFGFVGDVTKVHLEAVTNSIDMGQVPVLSCLGETVGGQTMNVNAGK